MPEHMPAVLSLHEVLILFLFQAAAALSVIVALGRLYLKKEAEKSITHEGTRGMINETIGEVNTRLARLESADLQDQTKALNKIGTNLENLTDTAREYLRRQ